MANKRSKKPAAGTRDDPDMQWSGQEPLGNSGILRPPGRGRSGPSKKEKQSRGTAAQRAGLIQKSPGQ